ncbi:LppA family lipoprotein [Nocardia noduli]|uniref:LppA family lipoprotein n=1 Tax=Nocardia noduli TaxID=2815722 RepID=UPI001C220F70|nr:LppA family lipoprotein [Nocardia noduli]
MTLREILGVGLIGVLLTLTGTACDLSGKDEMDEHHLARLEERLRSWPSLEDTARRITQAVDDIARAVTARVPDLHFEPSGKPTHGTCSGDFHRNRIGGVEKNVGALFAPGPIPDDVWPEVLADARRIAASYGVTQMELRVDKPGYHDVRFYDNTWNHLFLGHMEATSISGVTGCRVKSSTEPNPPVPPSGR